jgi:hypothetical protein
MARSPDLASIVSPAAMMVARSVYEGYAMMYTVQFQRIIVTELEPREGLTGPL